MTTETGFIVKAMEDLAHRYRIQHGMPALGYVMGLKDYRVMCQELAHMGISIQFSMVSEVREFQGLPIFLKISSGIELLVHRAFAERVLATESGAERLKMVEGAIIR